MLFEQQSSTLKRIAFVMIIFSSEDKGARLFCRGDQHHEAKEKTFNEKTKPNVYAS